MIPAPELKISRKRMPAASDEQMPMRIVSPMVIGSAVGRARQPGAPSTSSPSGKRKASPSAAPGAGGQEGDEHLVGAEAPVAGEEPGLAGVGGVGEGDVAPGGQSHVADAGGDVARRR